MSGPGGTRPRGGGRVGIVEGWELRQARQREANSGAWKGLVFVVIVIAALVVGGWIAARPVLGPAVTGLFEDNPGIIRIPILSDLLRAELGDRVGAPAGDSEEEIRFVIEPGQTIDQIQENLVEAGLLKDTTAFTYLVVSDRVDQLIQAGIYTMTPRMSPTDVVSRLAADPDPPTPVVNLALRPGLRIEQIVAYLEQQTQEAGLELDPAEFRELATNPPAELRDEYAFMRQIPEGNSLEGFLPGGVYPVEVTINADELLQVLLQQWEEESGNLVAQARRKGVDFYDALTIASLVEREVKSDKDRRKVAGVYWNRLDERLNGATGGLMQADPTVVYATDTMALDDMRLNRWPEYLFWDTLGVSDLATVDVSQRLQSHQTYQDPGLPDWPIASPSRESIEAALDPDKRRRFMFFYACPGSDTHRFARNAAQHDRNIARCKPE
jgi:UPF0755 protein